MKKTQCAVCQREFWAKTEKPFIRSYVKNSICLPCRLKSKGGDEARKPKAPRIKRTSARKPFKKGSKQK